MNRHYIREDSELPQFDHPQPQGQRWALGGIAVLLLICIGMGIANAQTAPTFTCTKTTGESPLATTCTWNYPGASACTAGGAGSVPAWSGSVPTSGTRNFAGITVEMTLTLDCTAPATGGKMLLRFIRPTKNTDGSDLTNLGGYLIEYGTAPGSLTQTRTVPVSAVSPLTPTTAVPYDSAYTLDGLTAGTWFAAMKVRTAACFSLPDTDCHESVRSNVTSAPVTTTPGGALPRLSVTLEPYTVPNPATNFVATEVTAFAIDENADGTLRATRIELVPLSTRCSADECTVLTRRQ